MRNNTSENKQQTTQHKSVSGNNSGNGISMPAVSVLQQKESDEATREFSTQQTSVSQFVSGAEDTTQAKSKPFQLKPNNTGMPDSLKTGVENLSGINMDHVRVHYNSSQPAQLNALAYAQGSDIHIGPGQEKHLPHEAWHIVQQAQGRVQPTTQLKTEVSVNDDPGLEHEADVMGEKALNNSPLQYKTLQFKNFSSQIVQRTIWEWTGVYWTAVRTEGMPTPQPSGPGSYPTERVSTGTERDLYRADGAAAPAARAARDGAAAAAAAAFDPGDSRQVINQENIAVYIDTHQDKHQHPSSVIFGPWQHKRGSNFAQGKDLAWHAANSAVTIRDYALAAHADGLLREGITHYPKKAPMSDGIIYDAAITLIGGKIYVVYHCNPPESE